MEITEVDKQRKLRVLHIITQLELGGAQKSTLYTVKKLDRDKFDVFLVSAKQGLLVEEAKEIKDCKIILLHSLRRRINPLFDLKALLDLINIIKKEKIDIVHTHSSKAGVLGRLAARFTGVKIVFHTIHGFSFNRTQNPLIKKIFTFLEKKTASISDGLIAICENDIKLGKKNKIGKKDRYCLLRESQVVLDSFPRQKEEDFLSPVIDERDNIVGTVTCFNRQKSPFDFIKACKIISQKVPGTKFIMIGDGPLRRKAEMFTRRLGLDNKIHFFGWRKDAADIINIFDVFLLTSRWEGLPLVFYEAMKCSKPIVATDVGGTKEVIKDEINGFLAEPGNCPNLAEKTIYLLRDKNMAKNMGKNGRQLLDTMCNEKDMMKGLESLYLRTAKEKIDLYNLPSD